MNEQKLYSTTDFYTTAVLIAMDFKIIKVTNEGPQDRVKRFHFEDTQELHDVVNLYLNGELIGSFRKFKNSVELVKDRVHAR